MHMHTHMHTHTHMHMHIHMHMHMRTLHMHMHMHRVENLVTALQSLFCCSPSVRNLEVKGGSKAGGRLRGMLSAEDAAPAKATKEEAPVRIWLGGVRWALVVGAELPGFWL